MNKPHADILLVGNGGFTRWATGLVLALAPGRAHAQVPSSVSTSAETREHYFGSCRLVNGSEKKRVLLKVEKAVTARVSYDWYGKTVFIPWIYPVGGLTDGSLMDPGKAMSTQTLELPFTPTDVVAMGPNRLAVAGASVRGPTLVRIYEFGPFDLPSVLPGASPQQAPELHVPVKSRETVFDEDLGHGHFFSALFWNRGRPDDLFAFMAGSDELHSLDTATQQLSLVASTLEQGGSLVAPLLSYPYSEVNDAHHRSEGCLYWFSSYTSSADILVFVDADCDGNLDTVQTVPIGGWAASDYGNASHYENGFDSAR